ncbi:MAG: hypothetical protein FWE95_09205 [Planctomycetaceae bacterium]|nr:hypothetical protein [Planctomycetaceae bacterium]
MQREKSTISFFRLNRWITVAGALLVFLVSSAFAQDVRQRQQECEKLFSAAVAAERQNDPIEAELRYEDCRDLAKKYRFPQMEAAAIHRIAVIRAKNNKFSESANLFRRAIELDPRNALILCDFAQLHAERKDYTEAEIILKNALNIDPNNPKVLYNLGIVIAMQRGDRHTEGLRYLRLALGEAEAYRELARIYRRKGELSRAEFADQKAELAESQYVATRVSTGGSDDDSAAVRLPQREPRLSQTPPEIVNRVHEELVGVEMREMVAEQHQAALPPLVRTSIVQTQATQHSIFPTTTSTVSAPPKDPFPVIAYVPSIHVATVQPSPQSGTAVPKDQPAVNSPSPIIPFVPATQPHGSPISLVRRLEASTGDTALAQSPVRMLPRLADPLLVVSSLNRVSDSKPASDHPASDVDVSAPQLVKVLPATQTATELPPRVAVASDTTRLISLPPAQTSSSSVGRTEQAKAANPLRQIPAERVGLIDPGADTSAIAALPAYSAMGIRRIPRADEPLPATATQPSAIVAFNTTESTAEPPRAPRPLPVRDIDVLQSPSAVIARRESSAPVPQLPSTPSVDNPYIVAKTQSEPSLVPEIPGGTPASETTRITQSTSRFSTATTPKELSFATVREESPPVLGTVEPVEVAAVKPLVSDAPSSATPSPVRLPEIATDASDLPKVAAIKVAPVAPSATTSLARMANEGTIPTPIVGELVSGTSPTREAPTGFATSRKPAQEVRVSGNNDLPGFARSSRK